MTLRNTKGIKTRTVNMTGQVFFVLSDLKQIVESHYVFPGRNGMKRDSVSKTFARTVQSTGLNDTVEDRLQKVTFHTLRHTFASWLVMAGVNIYTLQKIMGHSSISMTERYSHLAPDTFKAACEILEQAIAEDSGRKV